MALYQIETKHNDSECLQNLDELNKRGTLDKFYFGCDSGIHEGWAMIEAASETDALKIVPDFERGRAMVAKVSKYTPERIRQIHSMK